LSISRFIVGNCLLVLLGLAGSGTAVERGADAAVAVVCARNARSIRK